MEQRNELMAIYETMPMDANGQVEMKNVAHAMILSKIFVEAGLAPKGKDEKQVLGAILAGKQLGLSPLSAMQGIAVINGMPCLWGDAMVAIVKNSGLLEDEKVEYFKTESKETVAVRVTVKRKGIPTPYTGEFTIANAKQAGLLGKPGPWQQYPKRMLMNRARAFAYRDAFADVLKGFNVAEEIQDIPAQEVAATNVSPAPYVAEPQTQAKPKVTAESLIRAAAKKRKEREQEASRQEQAVIDVEEAQGAEFEAREQESQEQEIEREVEA